ncbi:MAG: right-handed parallel beta-helix repeat-containing protein [Deltaproteobacteria bacterium]|nr:right-handed parallel beta-helix repeat-containing protein [Deltaproteobacteria bacterium]
MKRPVLIPLLGILAFGGGCEWGTTLEGEQDDARTEVVEGSADAPPAEGGETADAIVDDGPACPIWVVPEVRGGVEDGSVERPYVGLRRALDARGSCDHVILAGATARTPFDAGVDINLARGQVLTIEGDPGAPDRAELNANDEVGLFATGDGTLVLRRLAVRRGAGAAGACLNADVREVRLEDTEWADCRATGECGAIWIHAANVRLTDSRFLRAAVPPSIDSPTSLVGAVCVDGPPDTSEILVERCRFEGNMAYGGRALDMRALTRNAVVRDCVFIDNTSRFGPVALGGIIGELEHNLFEANEAREGGPIVGVDGTPGTSITHNLLLENTTGPEGSALQASHGTVANNLFVDNVCDRTGCVAGIWVPGGIGGAVDVRNNTFVGNESAEGVAHLAFDSAFGRMRSNLFVGGAGEVAIDVRHEDWGLTAELTFSAWWDVPEPVWGESVRVGAGNIEADPRFAAGDVYELGTGSMAIDAGDPDPSLEDVDGSRNDIGAFGGPDGEWIPLDRGGAP